MSQEKFPTHPRVRWDQGVFLQCSLQLAGSQPNGLQGHLPSDAQEWTEAPWASPRVGGLLSNLGLLVPWFLPKISW